VETSFIAECRVFSFAEQAFYFLYITSVTSLS